MKTMKFITNIYLLLLAFSVHAQPLPTYTGTATSWAQYRGLYGSDSGFVFTPGDTFSRAEPVGTLRLQLSTFTFHVWTGLRWRLIEGTGGDGSTDTSSLSARIDARVKYSDTASLLAGLARKQVLIDTASAIRTSLVGKLATADTAAMLVPYATDQDLSSKENLSNKTTNANGTSSFLYPTQGAVKAFVDAQNALNAKYTDTSFMLLPYQRKGTSVQYTDTATMLAPYQRVASAVKYSDTSSLLTPYARKQLLLDSVAVIRALASLKIDSARRNGVNVQFKINGSWVTMYTDSVGNGGGGSTDSSLFATRNYVAQNFWKFGGNIVSNANTQYLGSDIDLNFSSYGTFFLMATAGRVRLGGNGNSNGGYNVTMVGGQNNTANGGSNYAVTLSGNSNQVSGPFQVTLSGMNNDLGAGAYSYALGGNGFLGNGKTGVGFEGDNYTTGKKAFLDHQSLKAFYNGYKFWCRSDSLEFDTSGKLRAPYIQADRFAYTATNASTVATAVNTEYAFYGSTATYTLPALNNNSGRWIRIVNLGTGTITVNSSTGGNDIFITAAAATTTVAAGAVLLLKCYTVGANSYWKTSQ